MTLRFESRDETRQGLIDQSHELGELVGGSPAMRDLYGLLRAVAPTPATVLVQGESGVGKELVARTLHRLSERKGELVVFDAASSDPEFVRSDLFGHLKGAFTGAGEARPGAFRAAHRGTLFLDEIGELPLDLQPRLLRVLEAREIAPIGSDKAVPVDVRLVAATHRDLAGMVAEGRFREDLYHRLSAFPVLVPPLRERLEDLPGLARHLLTRLASPARMSPEALARLAGHPWPGNVRELRNVLEKASILAGGGEILARHLVFTPRPGAAAAPAPPAGADLEAARDASERAAVEAALARHPDQASAARALGVSLATLKRRLKKFRGGQDPDA